MLPLLRFTPGFSAPGFPAYWVIYLAPFSSSLCTSMTNLRGRSSTQNRDKPWLKEVEVLIPASLHLEQRLDKSIKQVSMSVLCVQSRSQKDTTAAELKPHRGCSREVDTLAERNLTLDGTLAFLAWPGVLDDSSLRATRWVACLHKAGSSDQQARKPRKPRLDVQATGTYTVKGNRQQEKRARLGVSRVLRANNESMVALLANRN